MNLIKQKVILWDFENDKNRVVTYAEFIEMVRKFIDGKISIRARNISDEFGCTCSLAASVLRKHLKWAKIGNRLYAPPTT